MTSSSQSFDGYNLVMIATPRVDARPGHLFNEIQLSFDGSSIGRTQPRVKIILYIKATVSAIRELLIPIRVFVLFTLALC